MRVELKDVLHLYLGCECLLKRLVYPKAEIKDKITTSSIEMLNNKTVSITPTLRPLSDMTDDEKKELWKLVFNRTFGVNGSIVFINKETTLQHPRWVLSSGVERLGILLNGEVWYDSDLSNHKFNQHLITLFYLSQGFDLFGLIESGQAIDKTKLNP